MSSSSRSIRTNTCWMAVERIWAFHDRSLVYRHACHHSTCGACGMRVNGAEKLTCITPIRDVVQDGGTLRVEPLRNFPVISDLAVDMGTMYHRMDLVGHHTVNLDTHEAIQTEDRPAGPVRDGRRFPAPVGLHRVRAVHQRLPDHRLQPRIPGAGRAGGSAATRHPGRCRRYFTWWTAKTGYGAATAPSNARRCAHPLSTRAGGSWTCASR